MKLASYPLKMYLIFLGWTSAYKLHPWVPLHVLFGIISVSLFGIYHTTEYKRIKVDVLKYEDALIFGVVCSVALASIKTGLNTSLHYTLAYFYVFVIGYILMKVTIRNCIPLRSAKKWLVIGILIAALGSVVEFVIRYYSILDIENYLHRAHDTEVFVRGIYPRTASFATEPAVLSFYMETIGVISIPVILYSNLGRISKLMLLSLIVTGWVFTFSAAGVAVILISMCIIIIDLLLKKDITVNMLLYIAGGCLVVVSLANVYSSEIKPVVDEIVTKVTLQGNISVNSRFRSWNQAISVIESNPILGEGPGTAAAEGRHSYHSWYLFLTAESGLLTAFLLILFLSIKSWRIYTSNIANRRWYLVGFISGATHLAVISTFFNPFLWVLLIVFEVEDEISIR